MDTPPLYQMLANEARSMREEALRIISNAEDEMHRRRYRKGYTDKADEADWMRALADFYALEAQAQQKDREAAEAQAAHWREFYLEETNREHDYAALLQEQSELRNQ